MFRQKQKLNRRGGANSQWSIKTKHLNQSFLIEQDPLITYDNRSQPLKQAN